VQHGDGWSGLVAFHPGRRSRLPIAEKVAMQWRSEGRGGLGSSNPPKFRGFDKAEPNSHFRGKYIRNNLIRIRVSLICKLSGTTARGVTAPRSPFSLPSVLNWKFWTPPPPNKIPGYATVATDLEPKPMLSKNHLRPDENECRSPVRSASSLVTILTKLSLTCPCKYSAWKNSWTSNQQAS
jgi:hypothetical protein